MKKYLIFLITFCSLFFINVFNNNVKAEEIDLPYNFSYGSARVFTVDYNESTRTVKISATLDGIYTERTLTITKKYFLVQTESANIKVWQSDNIMTITKTSTYSDYWNVNNVELFKSITSLGTSFNDFSTPSSGNSTYYSYVSNYVKKFTNFDIYSNLGELQIQKNVELVPTISITKTNDMNIDTKVVRAKLNIKFSVYDTNKYIYKYSSVSQGIDDFYDISTNNEYDLTNGFDIYTNINDTFIISIYDKNTNNFVQASSYTITDIYEVLPYIKINAIKNDYCKINENGTSKTICKELKINIILPDLLNYQPYYSSDGGTTFEPFFEDSINEIYYDNADVIIKILKKSTNEIVDSSSYTITSIEKPNTTLPFIKFDSKFIEGKTLLDDSFSLLKTIVYNFDFNLYDIYLKTNENDFILDTSSFKNSSYLIFEKETRYIKDTSLIYKIVDKQGNYIDSFTFQVNYTSHLKNSNFFIKLIEPIKNKFPIFNQMISIYDLYSSYEFTEEIPNLPKVNMSFIGINKEFDVIDLSFYSKYRELIFNYIKLSLGLYTLFKVIKNVKSSF